ncbi:MAG: alpha/beta hydrolase, partial [Povalibacter sp.]
RELVFNAEGVEPAEYLAKLGVTAFALKYRLARETGSPYTLEEHVSSDIHRAMRLVRSNAALWNIDANRIGVMGWSAGAELAAMVAYRPSQGDATAADPVDRVSAAPNFQIIIYPGSYGIPMSCRLRHRLRSYWRRWMMNILHRLSSTSRTNIASSDCRLKCI